MLMNPAPLERKAPGFLLGDSGQVYAYLGNNQGRIELTIDVEEGELLVRGLDPLFIRPQASNSLKIRIEE